MPTHDQCFIDALWDKAMDSTINVESLSNVEAPKHAIQVVNLVMKEAFTLDANYSRYIKLRARFETFSYLISCSEVHWDRWENTIHAPTDFWEDVFERFPLTKAYEHFGEPNFNALRALFQGYKSITSKNENKVDPSGLRDNMVVIDVDEIVD
ncbi:hypothetical protein Salat_0877800 [Sesamum alatum]|uniref:Myb/SANT-like domain-containing protein n=1 Tax=Sesamum alatum TaxID=300844 RepID=A0AAE1YJC7_9LAMI|nr:hypothetical protein Salat_0877800 [Sesamum alatum]